MQKEETLKNNDQTDNEKVQTPSTTENTAEDGVVYVVNDDGTEFDASERTYVAVEGLEGELGSDDDDKDDDA
jgi:hypothetical protein